MLIVIKLANADAIPYCIVAVVPTLALLLPIEMRLCAAFAQ